MKRNLVLILTLLSFISVFADEPFRIHRYDAFKAAAVQSDQIVMIGNSITNMHEWWEALGNHKVINRGVSGAISDEAVANLDPILAGHPAKAFLLIGTNDFVFDKDREHIAENLQIIIDRFKKESPETKVYVQSILPSYNGKRRGKIAAANELIRTVCRKSGITYIDLYSVLGDGEGHIKEGWSFDDLHPKAPGYVAWINAILPYLNEGSNDKSFCNYPMQLPDIYEGRMNSWGARLGTLSLMPIEAEDIVFIGDEMIHSGEWHELLESAHAKNRGTGWGYPGCDINWLEKEIPNFMHGNPKSVCPATVVLYAGAQEVENKLDIKEFEAKYRSLLDLVHQEAPTAKVQLLSIAPNDDDEKDEQFTQPYNAFLKKIAKKDKMATFVDIYTPLKADDMMEDNYVMAKGYQVIANLVKQTATQQIKK